MSEPPRHLDRTRPRRLRIFSIVGIYAELDRIEAAATAGMLWEVGQWHAGNVLQQLARTIEYAIDGTPGYEYRPPWEFIADPRMRRNEMAYEAMSRLFWRFARSSHVQWGLRSDWSVLERVAKTRLERAPDRIAIEVGAAALRKQLARLNCGERMTARSPDLGWMTHKQWKALLLRRANILLGMLVPAHTRVPEQTA